MPIFPEGSPITIVSASPSPALTVNAAINALTFKKESRRFKRSEFVHERLKNAKNVDGSMPSFYYLSSNLPVQYFTNCNENETERPTTPDDSDLDNIYRRWDVIRYEMSGAISPVAEVEKLLQIHEAHKILLSRFEDHQDKAANADISYTQLVSMQAETFSYLTTTNVTLTAPALASLSPQSQLLLVEFSPTVEQEDPLDAAASSSEVLDSWTMVLERWYNVPASSSNWTT